VTLNEIGKRFERQLMLALPLALLCLVTSFLQLAHYEHIRNSERAVLQSLLSTVTGLQSDLELFYKDTKLPANAPSYKRHHKILDWKTPRQYDFVQTYTEALASIIKASENHHGAGTKRWLAPHVQVNSGPEQILASATTRLKAIESVVQIGEVLLPARPNVTVFGTSIAVPLKVIGFIGYFTSCLALILWYGSMRLTRRREMLALTASNFQAQPFPHLLNGTMTILVSDARAAQGKYAKANASFQKFVLRLLRSIVLFFIAGLTVLPLLYSSILLPFDFKEFQGPPDLLVSFPLYCIAGLIPSIQILVLWAEEMYWLGLAPIRILVRGRDI
jgi:hypothetical protein